MKKYFENREVERLPKELVVKSITGHPSWPHYGWKKSNCLSVLQAVAQVPMAVTSICVKYVFGEALENRTYTPEWLDYTINPRQEHEDWENYCNRTIRDASTWFWKIPTVAQIEKKINEQGGSLQEAEALGLVTKDCLSIAFTFNDNETDVFVQKKYQDYNVLATSSGISHEIIQIAKSVSLDGTLRKALGYNDVNAETDEDIKGIQFQMNRNHIHLYFERLDTIMEKGYHYWITDFYAAETIYTITILKTTDKFAVFAYRKTAGPNFNISTSRIAQTFRKWDVQLGIKRLFQATNDSIHFVFRYMPTDTEVFIDELIFLCPDIIDQQYGSKEMLLYQMKECARLELWWD